MSQNTSTLDTKKNKSKFVGYFNNILNRKSSSNSQSVLRTDAVPSDNNRQQNVTIEEIHENENENSPELTIVPTVVPNSAGIVVTPPFQGVNPMFPWPELNQLNQSSTVIGTQQVISLSNVNGGIQFGDTFHFGSQRHSNNGDNKNKKNKTKSTIELMNCTVEVEEQVMRIAARSIGENWRMVFRDLSVPNPEIEQIKEQYFHINLEETIYQLLVRWQQGSEDPSIGILSTVLWNNKCYECVTNLKNYYKKNIRPQSSF